MDAKGESGGGGGWGGMNWEIETDMYSLMCVEWVANESLLYGRMHEILKFKKKKEVLHSVVVPSKE